MYKHKLKGVLILILLSFLNIQCKDQNKKTPETWNFDSIRSHKELFLIQTDDKFGEWGGDTYFLRMYRDGQTENLIFDFMEYEGQLGPPKPPDPNNKLKINWFSGQNKRFESKGNIVNKHQLKLLSDAIQQLVQTRINNPDFTTMSGVANRIVYSDSTLIIEDYPSNNWNKFHTLIKELKSE